MILIPMAGASARFARAGYARPKYELPLAGATLFAQALRSFEALFASERFVLVHRDEPGVRGFIERELTSLGVREATLVGLPGPTEGQAHTVQLGLAALPPDALDEPLTVFNIDSIRLGYRPPAWQASCAGWLEVFRGEGEHWSFIEPGPDGRVLRTTEKQRISGWCSNGLYHFDSAGRFLAAFEAERASGLRCGGELYVAPLYNRLIADGALVRWREVAAEAMVFSGTPAEYEALLAQPERLARLERLVPRQEPA